MSFLTINALTKKYDDQAAVDQIDFSVEQGEFISLLGPSGCGKSTTLNMIAGLEQPTSGSVWLDGVDITRLAPGKRRLSMVFQSYALFPHLTVKENILFGLKARRVAKEEQQKRLKEAIELVDLAEHLNKKPGQLSGGQRQRVALARSIVSQAPLCLMDEPLSNLDTKLRNEMRSEIRRLQKSLGLTVIYVTHDQIEAMSMADKIILLNQGRIEQQGEPESFYSQPQSTFVAEFIGHPPMNVISHSGGYLTGVRPEHIAMVTQGKSAKVLDCDYQGSSTVVQIQLMDREYEQSKPVSFLLEGKQSLQPGRHIHIGWSPDDEHPFCITSGRRLSDHKPQWQSAI